MISDNQPLFKFLKRISCVLSSPSFDRFNGTDKEEHARARWKPGSSCVANCSPVVSRPNYAARYKRARARCVHAAYKIYRHVYTFSSIKKEGGEEKEDHTRNWPGVRKRWLNSVSTFRSPTDYRVPRIYFFPFFYFSLSLCLLSSRFERLTRQVRFSRTLSFFSKEDRQRGRRNDINIWIRNEISFRISLFIESKYLIESFPNKLWLFLF